MKHLIFKLGLQAIRLLQLDKTLSKYTQGLGAILMLHHVRPYTKKNFNPNRLLEITPEFLDETLMLIRNKGFEIISMDDVPNRICNPKANRPFIAITLDDGYNDLVEHALPVFKKHQAPFTAYMTTGFADGIAPLWWLDLEHAIQKLDFISLEIDDMKFEYDAQTHNKKTAAFKAVYWRLRATAEETLRKVIAALASQAGIDSSATTSQLCLDWDGIRQLSKEPLATIGAHTLTHPMVAKHSSDFAQKEIEHSKAIITREIGKQVQHFAYPVGDYTSAARRDFALAKAAGFMTGVTTRPGMVFAEHKDHLHALPRLSVNGLFQNTRDLDTLLSGVPFALINRGRRLNV